jgi:hypothetical protein
MIILCILWTIENNMFENNFFVENNMVNMEGSILNNVSLLKIVRLREASKIVL